ncbi:MAG: protein kinase domain-containing protein [Prosthecobacter sp.]
MAAAAMATDGGADTIPLAERDLPSLQEIAAAFPDLEILDLIGHGGMSAVFRARQPKLDRFVALKVLPKSLAATPGFPERFTREGRVLARLSHPHIVTVHDFGESGGFCYLVMEHVDGVNLRQAMRAGRFTPEQALNIVPPLCDALQFAHSQGVLHRDIKPENILLDSKGRVKIADFGIAKILGEDGGDSMLLTQSGAKLGTAPYMAPEQIEKPASVDHRADIYSLGVVFYEMLTGELPLGRFAAPSEKAAVNGNMDEIVFRALAKERERRQQSAGEFKTQVEGLGSMPLPMQRALAQRFQSFEYKSKRTLFGMPLLHVTSGIDPATGQKRVARGFFAFGDIAVGVAAFGGYARGVFACGGLAVGVVAFGGISVGLVCWGGVALALLLALGGLAIGPLATGGLAMGWQALGGLAVGWHGHGGMVFARHGIGAEVHAPHVYQALAEMPAALRGMASASRWITLCTFLWLPLMLPMPVMSWWARRQLALAAHGGEAAVSQDKSARVFWLIPAVLLLGGVLWWMLYRWATDTAGVSAFARFLVPTVVGGFGLMLFAFSLPLWLRLVPMNSIYGLRLPSTFASEARWYEANARFGKHMGLWSLMIIGAGVAGFYQLPRHQDAYSWAAITLCLVGVAASVTTTLWWLRQHAVDAPARKKNWFVVACGNIAVAVVIALFFKSFIAAPYEIAGGVETGVTKGSHWMVSRLDTGFNAGDLIVFQHDSDLYWIARVVALEQKGLRLKRGGAAEEFFMPWDRIAGKMLFAHFSPMVVESKSAARAPAENSPLRRIPEPTSFALKEDPKVLFTRLVPNGIPWMPEVWDAAGKPVSPTKEVVAIIRDTSDECISDEPHDCWLQVWLQHPDLDEESYLKALPFDEQGRPVAGRDTVFENAYTERVRPAGGHVHSLAFMAGRQGHVPPKVELAISYSLGPWDAVKVVDKNPSSQISTDDWIKGGVGEDTDHRAFVSWLRRRADRQIICVAFLKDGTRRRGLRGTTSSGKDIMDRARFDVRLDEVERFELWARDIRRMVVKDVVVPPLSEPVVYVQGPAAGQEVRHPWRRGLTLGDLLELTRWAFISDASGKPMSVSLVQTGLNENIQVNDKSRRWQINPGDRLILSP